MPPVFPYGLPGYGPAATTTTITDAQQIQPQGENSQQIKQPTNISTEPAGKRPTHQVLAAMAPGDAPEDADREADLAAVGLDTGGSISPRQRSNNNLAATLQVPCGRRIGGCSPRRAGPPT